MQSVPRTFRFSSDLVDKLEEEARRQRRSVNGLVCKVLEKYLNVEVFLERFGYLIFPQSIFAKLLEKVDVELLEEIGREIGGETARELILQIWGELTPRNFCRYLEEVMCGCARWANCYIDRIDSGLKIRLGHGYGGKWSKLLRIMVEETARQIPGMKIKFDYVSEYSVVFTLTAE